MAVGAFALLTVVRQAHGSGGVRRVICGTKLGSYVPEVGVVFYSNNGDFLPVYSCYAQDV